MSSSSDSVNTLTLSPRLRVPPACRFLFTPFLLVWSSSPARSWKRATLLMGTSSTSAMWNFASMAPACVGYVSSCTGIRPRPRSRRTSCMTIGSARSATAQPSLSAT